ncbi:translation initiation factor IF-3 [Myxococcota bacterium]|nr:translation initiation factor IF-3 [Myxococcota bacterium]MBU1534226.1 translation initiation factor IF-3 [Myxococcota bacterium]
MAKGQQTKSDQYRINRRIRVPEVRVIGHEGTQLGIMNTRDALEQAISLGLDLVEVSPKAVPPVCKIMDYGRFKYEKSKQDKQKRQNASHVTVKEIKFRPKTDTHDMDYKLNHIRKFLANGDKIRVVVVFRGREIVHPDFGFDVLAKVIELLGDECEIEQKPNREGRAVAMLLGPPPSAKKPKKPVVSSGPAPEVDTVNAITEPPVVPELEKDTE